MEEKKINKKPEKFDPLVVPAGTQQETGLTRAETEKANEQVKMPPILPKKSEQKKKAT